MPHTLDKIDTQLLTILQKNSNRTTKSIAEELGMSTSPIFERIKKLEKEGYIVKEINNFPEVVECHRVSGNFDYLLKLVVEDIEAYETFIISKLTLLPYLGNVQSLIALSTSKETNEIDLSRVL